MSDRTKISWCDSTFNPWIGCTKVSDACLNCYAAVSTPARTLAVAWGAGQQRRRTTPQNWHQPLRWAREEYCECPACGWRGERRKAERQEVGWVRSCCPACNGDALRTARRRVFCASLADVFDNEVPVQWRSDMLMLVRATPQLDWLLLTKRVGNVVRMLGEVCELLRAQGRNDGAEWVNEWASGSPPAQVWLGATIPNQKEADRDVVKLLATPARVRFVSMEPLLGAVRLDMCSHEVQERSDDTWTLNLDALGGFKATSPYSGHDVPRLDWVIAGGESGPQARPVHPDWARSLRDQCERAGVPFLWKQWGEYMELDDGVGATLTVRAGDPCFAAEAAKCAAFIAPDGEVIATMDAARDGVRYRGLLRPGKEAAGRLLDGRLHHAFPVVLP